MMVKRTLACCCSILLLAGAAVAEEPFGVSLLDPNSLAGWEHSATPARGWSIEKGVLRGTKDSTRLLSGWTFGNFELRFRYRGACQMELPQAPNGTSFRFQLPDRPEGNAAISAIIRRVGDLLTCSVDGRELARAEALPSSARLGLSLSSQGTCEISNLQVQEFASGDEPAGTLLFNGHDLGGWWTPGSKNAWGVKDGNLALIGGGGNYLRSDKEYGNFTLSLEYKIRKRGNSGIGIRTAKSGWPSSDGMEMQIEDGRKKDASATMAIYRNLEPIALAEKTDDWNRAVIKADGRMVSAWLNGVLVQQVNTHYLPELRHRPLQGWIGFQDHAAPIEFRNIRIIDAPAGLGLDAWYAPRTEPASRLVLDRLMNPIRLATPDGSKSGAASASITDAGEHMLAEIRGPGAITRISRSADSGTLAFYFDGEDKPRIECPAAQLHQHVPRICGDANPVLTFLGYEKSLKVVLRHAKSAEYRLEYVSLPPSMPVETFRHKTQSIARGMLDAIDYRHFQIGHGTYRDNDPLPRAASGNKTLPPGERVPLVELKGAGDVNWLRLGGDPKRLLANDDLWLEITVDGESQPALIAPARYLFPGLEEGKNYHNFLVLNKGGAQCVLPMPYNTGLSIAAINRGQRPLKDVAVTVSYEPATSHGRKRPVLRGVFLDAATASADHAITFSGRGRWIGLISRTPEKSTTLDLEIDGQGAAGWQHVSWQQLTGLPAGKLETRNLSGQTQSLAWCFHLLAPVDFQGSFRLRSADGALGSSLALFYAE